MLKFMNLTDAEPRASNVIRQFQENVIENAAVGLFMEISRILPQSSRQVAQLMSSLVSGGEDVNYAHRIFASKRAVRFQEMEYSLPLEYFGPAMHDLQRLFETSKPRVAFPVECRVVRQDDIDLSPAYGRDSAYIAVHEYRGKPYQAYFDAVEAIFRRYEGRPHWGKLHTRTAAELSALYPKWEVFHQVREQCDPEGVFLTPYLQSILGAVNPGSKNR